MADIQMQSVISSNISSAGFDAATGTMRVAFTSGGVYEAPSITQSDFDAFMAAKSKGVHFNKVMKRAFTWSKIEKKG
jgi:hypothetical protein